MQTYDFFWYAGALPDFVWQAGTSLQMDVFEDHSTPENDVLFRFRNVIDNGYDEGGIVNLFMDTGSVGGLFTDVSIGARSAGALFTSPGDLDPANLDSGQAGFLQFGKVALTPEQAWGRAAAGLISGVNPGEFLSLRASLAEGAGISDVLAALNVGLAGNYTDATHWTLMTSEELAAYKAGASAGLRFSMLFHGVVPNWVDPDGHGLYVTGSLAGTSDDPGQGADDDELVGTAGSETLDGGVGADVMAGLAGDDTYHVDNFDDWVLEAAGQGSDTIVSTVSIILPANVEKLVLQAISAEGNELDNVIVASNGNNYIDGKAGIDTISYAAAPGPVSASISLTSIQSTGGSGNDMLLNFENITGSAFNDALSGNGGANVIDGGTGADTMSGFAGDDTYIVDNLGDVVTGESGGVDTVQSSVSFTLPSGFEHIVLTGGTAANATGNSLANRVTGNVADNVLIGLGGNDTLDGGLGGDQLIGGTGNDLYRVDHVGDVVVELAGEGTDTVESPFSYTLGANVEKLVLTGSSAVDGTGNTLGNTLTGNSAANTLYGLDGIDTLDGLGGADQMFGGAGNDTYVVDNAGDVVTELSGQGTDTVKASISYTLGANVEKLTLTGSAALSGTGNTLANTITGNSGANALYGAAGNDTLDGGTGADLLYGNAGNDTYVVDNAGDSVVELSGEGTDTVKSSIAYVLGADVEKLTLTGSASIGGTGNELANTLTGNTGNNYLDGGSGNDIIAGGKGVDSLWGGLGADKFDFNAITDSLVGPNRDLVLDFSRIEGDKIDLSTIDANPNLSGNQVFGFIGESAFTGAAGQVRAASGGIAGGTLIQIDTNGDTLADLEVGLAGFTLTLASSDFIL
jgi:Ca2+-binding RTX toxin-like protein